MISHVQRSLLFSPLQSMGILPVLSLKTVNILSFPWPFYSLPCKIILQDCFYIFLLAFFSVFFFKWFKYFGRSSRILFTSSSLHISSFHILSKILQSLLKLSSLMPQFFLSACMSLYKSHVYIAKPILLCGSEK